MNVAEPQPAVPKPKRRWLRRTLWGALALVLVISIPCSWIVLTVQHTKKRSWAEAKRQREAVLAIRKSGGDVLYDFQVGEFGPHMEIPDTRSAGVAWLQDRLGVDLFADVVAVKYNSQSPPWREVKITDANALSYLKGLPKLRTLNLFATGITDAALPHIGGLPQLNTLVLIGTNVSDEGVQKLQRALPNCKIYR